MSTKPEVNASKPWLLIVLRLWHWTRSLRCTNGRAYARGKQVMMNRGGEDGVWRHLPSPDPFSQLAIYQIPSLTYELHLMYPLWSWATHDIFMLVQCWVAIIARHVLRPWHLLSMSLLVLSITGIAKTSHTNFPKKTMPTGQGKHDAQTASRLHQERYIGELRIVWLLSYWGVYCTWVDWRLMTRRWE